MKAISREELFMRLQHLVDALNDYYCDGAFDWPPGELLGHISECVEILIEFERKKRPWALWEAFEILDRRRRTLRLVPRINGLVKRAIARHEKIAKAISVSPLSKAERQPDSIETQLLLRDCAEHGEKFVALFHYHMHFALEGVEAQALRQWLYDLGHPDALSLVINYTPRASAELAPAPGGQTRKPPPLPWPPSTVRISKN